LARKIPLKFLDFGREAKSEKNRITKISPK